MIKKSKRDGGEHEQVTEEEIKCGVHEKNEKRLKQSCWSPHIKMKIKTNDLYNAKCASVRSD